MARTEDILSTALVFAGSLDEQQRSVLERLCAAADSDMALRLREDVTPEDCYDSYVCACAWMALSGLGSVRDGAGVESFTAGTLTVRKSTGASNCLAMQAEVLMAPYVQSSGFRFRRV